ncbi:hypothetical protein D3C81_2317590 [compost metagenome]
MLEGDFTGQPCAFGSSFGNFNRCRIDIGAGQLQRIIVAYGIESLIAGFLP